MWIYKGKEIKNIEDFGDITPFGFIYKITNLTNNHFYIGKKQLINKINKKLGKKELLLIKEERKKNKIQGKLPTSKPITIESNWMDYWGSCKPLLAEIKNIGKDKFRREIIHLAYNKKQLGYYEVVYQITENVLGREDSYNQNIAGKYHKGDI